MLEAATDWSKTGSCVVLPRIPDSVEEAKREALKWALDMKISSRWFPPSVKPALTEMEERAVTTRVEKSMASSRAVLRIWLICISLPNASTIAMSEEQIARCRGTAKRLGT